MKRLVVFLLVLSLVASFIVFNPEIRVSANPAYVECAATQDTDVRQANPDTNYGSDASMYAVSQIGYRNARMFSEFDLSAILSGTNILQVFLKLYVEEKSSGTRDYLFGRIDGSWSEGSATWNSQPSIVGGEITSTRPDATGWWEIDVTDLFAADGLIGFRVKDKYESFISDPLYTKAVTSEGASANRPVLRVIFNYYPTNDAFTLKNPSISTKGCLSKKQAYTFEANITDQDGASNVNYVDLTLDQGGQNIRVRWLRSTNAFSEQSDPYNYITLTGSSSSSENAWTINFLITFSFTYPDESQHACRLYVIDNDYLDDTNDYTNVYYVENDLIFSSLTVDDYHCDPLQTLSFSGMIYYQGTVISPNDGDYQVKVYLGTGQSGSTDITLVSGGFAVDDVLAPNVKGQYNYTVQCNYNASFGSFNPIIVDRYVISITANTTSPQSGEEVNFTVLTTYEYDGTPVPGGTISISRNGTYFADNNFTDTKTEGNLCHYTANAISDPNYGLTNFTCNSVTVYWSALFALTVRVVDLDSEIISDATVTMNNGTEYNFTSDASGLATLSAISDDTAVSVKVLWHGCYVNGTWSKIITATQTIDAVCDVWTLTVNAKDEDGQLLSFSPTIFDFLLVNGTEGNYTGASGSVALKVMNGTHYVKVYYQEQAVCENASFSVSNKNVVSLNKTCSVFSITVLVTSSSNSPNPNSAIVGASISILRDGELLNGKYTIPSEILTQEYNETYANYVFIQMAYQESSYSITVSASGYDSNSTETALISDVELNYVLSSTAVPSTSGGTPAKKSKSTAMPTEVETAIGMVPSESVFNALRLIFIAIAIVVAYGVYTQISHSKGGKRV